MIYSLYKKSETKELLSWRGRIKRGSPFSLWTKPCSLGSDIPVSDIPTGLGFHCLNSLIFKDWPDLKECLKKLPWKLRFVQF